MQLYTGTASGDSETTCNDRRFTPDDLANLASLTRGGPADPHRFNVRAVEDFLAGHDDVPPAEAVIELLLLIRGA